MKKVIFLFLFFITSCQIPVSENIQLTADSYLDEIPTDKTAILHLANDKVSRDSIEYKKFFQKLKTLLERKGYVFTTPANVLLRVDFGSDFDRYARIKKTVETGERPFEFDEMYETLSSIYDRKNIYKKHLTVTAVQASNTKNEYWKTTVFKEDEYPDFRASEDYLLYLFSHIMEKDTKRQITENITDTEFYQRYVLHYNAAETSDLFPTEQETRRNYEKRLQAKIDNNKENFKKCGLVEKERIAFMISPFGTLPSFGLKETNTLPHLPIDEKVRSCIAKYLEPLIEPPVNLDTTQPFSVKIPLK